MPAARDAAWTVAIALLVVFAVLVFLEVSRRSSWRSPVNLAADFFTRTDVRNEMPVQAGAESPPVVAPAAAGNDVMA